MFITMNFEFHKNILVSFDFIWKYFNLIWNKDIKAIFVKLRQIDEFETIIPIIVAIIMFVNCKLWSYWII